jgi:hypothetical protein
VLSGPDAINRRVTYVPCGPVKFCFLTLNIPTTRLSLSSFSCQRPRISMEGKNQLSSPSCSRRKECRRDGIDPPVTTVSAKREKIFSHVFSGKTYSIRLGMFLKVLCSRSTPRFSVGLPSPPCQRKQTGHSIISVRVRVFYFSQLFITFCWKKKSALMMQLSHQTVADMGDSPEMLLLEIA